MVRKSPTRKQHRSNVSFAGCTLIFEVQSRHTRDDCMYIDNRGYSAVPAAQPLAQRCTDDFYTLQIMCENGGANTGEQGISIIPPPLPYTCTDNFISGVYDKSSKTRLFTRWQLSHLCSQYPYRF